MPPKPPYRPERPNRLHERSRMPRMTIAIGMNCWRGILIAADTLVTYPDGTAKEMTKVTSFRGKSGIFVIANASSDLNATRTMVNSLTDRLAKAQISDVRELQKQFSEETLAWYGKLANDQASQLVFGCKLDQDAPRLFYCEPPSTFLPITDGYVGAGGGAFVTDPLHKKLFGTTSALTPVQVALRRMSYLIYRAKQENALCGKRTTCTVIGVDSMQPIEVNVLDLEAAEKYGTQLDFLLGATATLYLGSIEENIDTNAQGIASMLKGQKTMRAALFHDTGGQEISLQSK